MEALFHIAPWKIMFITGSLLVLGEILVGGFVLLPIGIAFILNAALAPFVANWGILLVTLALIEVAVFYFFKKYVHALQPSLRTYTNVEGMVGQECLVTEIIPIGGTGYVKLYGDHWAARSYSEVDLLPGTRVQIVKVDGNKVLVEEINN